ncbi:MULTISPECIES: hypothetical protein [Acidianus]|uniref:Dehydrogenase n=1 Tax=Candidatus Acidianus copahuensis TaxID=1160895 RepID=A0A031LSA0_9CREN|nr:MULTISPECIES: hypothetical protein [Acidianus]EZQ11262.1 dehydrogenase [Candidatus Acidianus copahuensis]NON63195.1 dehydrogenase [Acidianus sp. RZ1]
MSQDIVQISKLPEKERENAMEKLFEGLMKMNDDKAKLDALKSLIKEMVEKATDDEYINLCLTNLKIASKLPDEQLKPFIQLRLRASQELPANLSKRDNDMMQKALKMLDPKTAEKISRNMR